MDANTFLELPRDEQADLLAEAQREGWYFEVLTGALSPDEMAAWAAFIDGWEEDTTWSIYT